MAERTVGRLSTLGSKRTRRTGVSKYLLNHSAASSPQSRQLPDQDHTFASRRSQCGCGCTGTCNGSIPKPQHEHTQERQPTHQPFLSWSSQQGTSRHNNQAKDKVTTAPRLGVSPWSSQVQQAFCAGRFPPGHISFLWERRLYQCHLRALALTQKPSTLVSSHHAEDTGAA